MMSWWRPDSSSWMITDAVRCMADTRARPSWTPLSRMMRGALVGDGDDFFARLMLKVRYAVWDAHETIPPRAMQRSTCGRYRLLQGRRYSPPVETAPLFAHS